MRTTFTLPAVPPSNGHEEVAPLPQSRVTNTVPVAHKADLSILVADDDPAMVRVLCRLMAPLGRVRFALRGEDVLRLVQEERPDLILLDAELPDLSGFEVCLRIKADPLLSAIPVIFVTSHSDEAFEQRGLDAGAADFISKPIRPAILLARVKTQLRLKSAIDGLQRMANTDALTGLANRRVFDDAFQREWARALRSGTPLAVLMIDVDHFKRFNDNYGHGEGDRCLQAVAAELQFSINRPGDFVARYGGEEFVVLLPETPLEGARRVGERLLHGIQKLGIPHAWSPGGLVSVSIGIGHCEWPTAAEKAQPSAPDSAHRRALRLLEAADEALYNAKAAGRNRVESVGCDCSRP